MIKIYKKKIIIKLTTWFICKSNTFPLPSSIIEFKKYDYCNFPWYFLVLKSIQVFQNTSKSNQIMLIFLRNNFHVKSTGIWFDKHFVSTDFWLILDFFSLQITNYYVVSVNRISLIRRLLDIVKIWSSCNRQEKTWR